MEREPILIEREKTHGDFFTVANVAQSIKEIIRDNFEQPSVNHLEALDLIATKIGRICSGNPNERDHWDDIAGYAKLGAEACK